MSPAEGLVQVPSDGAGDTRQASAKGAHASCNTSIAHPIFFRWRGIALSTKIPPLRLVSRVNHPVVVKVALRWFEVKKEVVLVEIRLFYTF